jgi:hypothetical protein
VFTPGTEVCAVPDLNTEFLQAFTEGQEPQNASLPNRYGWISP